MITRIVRMTFRPDATDEFLKIFEASKSKIRAFPGCQYLSLHQDHHSAQVFYTLSHWESQAHLDAYRGSELFKTTWTATKRHFADKPIAFSLDPLIEIE